MVQVRKIRPINLRTEPNDTCMHRYEFQLRLTAAEWRGYYRGAFRHVVIRSTAGEMVQLSAEHLLQFVTLEGVHGRFELVCNARHKFVGLKRTDVSG